MKFKYRTHSQYFLLIATLFSVFSSDSYLILSAPFRSVSHSQDSDRYLILSVPFRSLPHSQLLSSDRSLGSALISG